MDAVVQRTIDELVGAAERHDAGKENRLDRWRVLDPDAGRFVWFLAQAVAGPGDRRGRAPRAECRPCGWPMRPAATGGRVLSIDTDAAAQEHARRSVTAAGLADHVDFRAGDGGAALADLADGAVDLLFLDAERTEYPSWWPHPVRVLRAGGVLVVDNALSHPAEIEPVRELLERDGRLSVTTIPVGKGELVALRR